MGNYKARRPGFLEGWKIDAANWMFQGFTDNQIAEKLDGERIAAATEYKKKAGLYKAWKDKLQRLRKDPKFQEYYRSIVTEWRVHNYGPALNVLTGQMKSDEPWLANKAANDVLNRIGNDPFSDNLEAGSVTIKFEGMPELGSPETEEADATGND